MQWVVENAQNLVVIGSAVVLAVLALLQRAGWVSKEARDEMARGVEESTASIAGALRGVDAKTLFDKDGKLNLDAVAKISQKAVKGTIKQRMLRAGRAIGAAIADSAAEADPDPTKKKRSVARRLSGIIRSRIPFLGG